MPKLKARPRDMRFVPHEVLDGPSLWARLAALAETSDGDTADALPEVAARVAGQLIAPINRSSDEGGGQWQDGVATTPAGFKQADATYLEGGRVGLSGDRNYRGMGRPRMLAVQLEEILNGAGSSFPLYEALSSGACLVTDAHASEKLEFSYLPLMYEGCCAGSMCLTIWPRWVCSGGTPINVASTL